MYQNLFWAGASLWTPLRCLQSSSHPNFVVGWREGCFLLIAFASTTAFTILIYRCFHGTAPPYLMDSCALTAEVTGRQHLRSATQRKLVVPRYRLNSFGCRRFSVAGPSTWNSLPDSLRYPELSLDTFKRQLKTYIFAKYWWQNVLSALEIFLSMRYINLHFTYLLTFVLPFFKYKCKWDLFTTTVARWLKALPLCTGEPTLGGIRQWFSEASSAEDNVHTSSSSQCKMHSFCSLWLQQSGDC